MDKEGKLEKKPFFETVEWAKKNKKINIFSVKINGKYNAEIKELLDLAQKEKLRIYQVK